MIEGERAALRPARTKRGVSLRLLRALSGFDGNLRYRLLDLGPAAGTAKCAHAVRLLKLVASNPTAVQLATAAVVVGWARG